MTISMALLFVVLAVMVYLFVTERVPVDLTAFLGLAALLALGQVRPEEAFQGFSSPAVMTMFSIFIVSGALARSGVGDVVGEHVHRWVGPREALLVAAIMVLCALLSAFMNNVAATAVFMPAVVAIARRARIAPSRLFIPLAFASILGGTTTLVGTPSNLLTAQMMQERGLAPFGLFDFTPIGLALVALGVAYMLTIGRRLLPRAAPGASSDPRADLTQVYRLKERLFSVRIPERSPLAGMTLRDTELGASLGIHVVQILRGGRRQLAPGNDAVIHAGDVLVVAGRFEELQERLRVRGVVVESTPDEEELEEVSGYYDTALVHLRTGAPLVGRRLGQSRLRETFGVVVAGVWRAGELRRDHLSHLVLAEGDELLVVGVQSAVDRIADHPDFEPVTGGPPAIERLRQSLFLVRIPDDSPLVREASTLHMLETAVGGMVAAVVRGGETVWAASPDEPMHGGDRLLIAGAPSRVLTLMQLGDLEIDPNTVSADVESSDVGVVEAVVSPRARIAGKSLAELGFRERYGLAVLAVWREGAPIRAGLAELPIRIGDALLLQGPKDKTRRLRSDPDFLVLTEAADQDEAPPPRTAKAPFALLGLLVMIALVVTRAYPVEMSAFLAAVVVLATRVLRTDEAYRMIEWRAIFLVAALLPFGVAMERTGAARLLADTVTALAGDHGPYAVLAALAVTSSLFSQALDGPPTLVLLAPVAMAAAERLHVDPRPLMMGVGLSASAAFMVPFSHKANLLVMAAGGYRVRDYMRVGTPLTLLMLAAIVALVPRLFPF